MSEYSIELKDVNKGYTYDLDKFITPEETLKRVKEKLRHAGLDILQDTVRIDNGRLGIPVYFSICGSGARQLIGTKKQMGKGGTPQQAEASAIMELVERFSLYSFLKRDMKEMRYSDVKENAIPFEYIASSVHDNSDAYRLYDLFCDISLRWCWAYNITKNKAMLIPIDWFFMINQYNGASAGNCNEEAILQGACEVVERHVSAIVCNKHINTASVDISGIKDPLAKELIKKYEDAGINLFINDFSLDTGIPTISIIAHDPTTFPESSEIVWTAGTTTCPEKSLIRALTEVAQLGGDFNTGSNYVPSGLPKPKSMDDVSYVIDASSCISIHDLPDISDQNIRIEIERLVSAISRKDMDLIILDITHPVLDIPAFYAIMPGAYFRERAKGASLGMFMARLMLEKGDPFKTLHMLDNMEECLSDKRYYIDFFRGLSYMYIGEMGMALKYFRESLRLNPETQDIPIIYSYMAHCLKEMEKYKDAINALEKAEEYDDTRTDVYNLMGVCYFKLKDYKNAIRCFEKVIKIDPSSAIDYANMGVNYEKMGKIDEAIKFYKIALELDPMIEFAKNNLQQLISSMI